MRRPTFLFIGPDKTGSSWIYEILKQHPGCYVPPLKDLYFFDRYYERGLDWYLAQFRGAHEGAVAIGELSHDYLFSPDAARRIARDLPGVKLLTCLREPVERTFSHYLFLVRSGRTRLPFDQALDRFPELTHNSLYARHLRPYLELFPASHLKVLWFEQLRNDPGAFAAEIFGFLGVPFLDDLDYDERVLPASRPRSQAVVRAVRAGTDLARRWGLTRIIGILKRNRVIQRTLFRPYTNDERPTMSEDTRSRLCDRFRPEIAALEELLDVDLANWRGQVAAATEPAEAEQP